MTQRFPTVRYGCSSCAIFVLLACFTATTAFAQLRAVPLDQRIDEAPLIFEGKVLTKDSYWNAERTLIFTRHQIEVYKYLKGESYGTQVEFVTRGGVVGLEAMHEHPGLELDVDQIGLFLSSPAALSMQDPSQASKQAALPIFHSAVGPQGFILYNPATRTASDPFNQYRSINLQLYQPIERAVGRPPKTVQTFDAQHYLTPPPKRSTRAGFAAPSITSFSPTTVTGGTQTELTISGTGFGTNTGSAAVFFDDPDDGSGNNFSAAPSTHIQSWSDTEIRVWVPSDAGTGNIQVRDASGTTTTSGSTLTVSYSLTNVNPDNSQRIVVAELIDDNELGGYSFTYHTDFVAESPQADATNRRARFEAALETWRCGTQFNAQVNDPSTTTTTTSTAGSDGTNIVAFDSADNLPNGVLGRATSFFTGCVVDSNEQWYLSEIDIRFDENPSGGWYYGSDTGSIGGSQSDFESVALHEIGHGHQLQHINNTSAIMFFSITSGTTKRTLDSSSDDAGGEDVKNRSTDGTIPCSQTAMTAVPGGECSNAVLPVELVAFDAVLGDEEIIVTWQTGSETNNLGFEVEQRYFEGAYQSLGFVEGAGSTLEAQSYEYRIPTDQPGSYTIRLKQIDFDGSTNYSPEVSVALELPTTFVFANAYPNPFRSQAQVSLMVKQEQNVVIEAYDVLGQRVAQLFAGTLTAERPHHFTFDGSTLSSGLYFIRATGEAFQTNQSILLSQ